MMSTCLAPDCQMGGLGKIINYVPTGWFLAISYF